MGNAHSFWPPGKLFKAKRKEKTGSQKRSPKRSPENDASAGPMYDTVADFPVYSVVDKRQSKVKVEENVQYAEIEVVRPPAKGSKSNMPPPPKPPPETEYASIKFPPATNAPQPSPPQKAASHRKAANVDKPRIKDAVNGTLV